MHTDSTHPTGFKRQVVFRISAEEWPLLAAAAHEHGSIQAAVLAGIRALATSAHDLVGRQPADLYVRRGLAEDEARFKSANSDLAANW